MSWYHYMYHSHLVLAVIIDATELANLTVVKLYIVTYLVRLLTLNLLVDFFSRIFYNTQIGIFDHGGTSV